MSTDPNYRPATVAIRHPGVIAYRPRRVLRAALVTPETA
jgi:hypothetical protein